LLYDVTLHVVTVIIVIISIIMSVTVTRLFQDAVSITEILLHRKENHSVMICVELESVREEVVVDYLNVLSQCSHGEDRRLAKPFGMAGTVSTFGQSPSDMDQMRWQSSHYHTQVL
jgi:hypothetical protein